MKPDRFEFHAPFLLLRQVFKARFYPAGFHRKYLFPPEVDVFPIAKPPHAMPMLSFLTRGTRPDCHSRKRIPVGAVDVVRGLTGGYIRNVKFLKPTRT